MLLTIALPGCGFTGEVWKTDVGYRWKTNRPCSLECPDGFKTDGKTNPLIEIKTNDVVGGKIGG